MGGRRKGRAESRASGRKIRMKKMKARQGREGHIEKCQYTVTRMRNKTERERVASDKTHQEVGQAAGLCRQ
jgi:hypothetical protein